MWKMVKNQTHGLVRPPQPNCRSVREKELSSSENSGRVGKPPMSPVAADVKLPGWGSKGRAKKKNGTVPSISNMHLPKQELPSIMLPRLSVRQRNKRQTGSKWGGGIFCGPEGRGQLGQLSGII